MSSKQQRSSKRERHIRIRAVRKDPPDLRKLAGALIALAQAQAEADAEAEATAAATPQQEEKQKPTRPGSAA